MNVTLLYFDGCPNWPVADAHLRALALEHPEMLIERRIVNTVEGAEATRFRGSPSFTVDGVDPFAFADADVSVGLSCRMYQTSQGPSGTPTLDQLRTCVTGCHCAMKLSCSDTSARNVRRTEAVDERNDGSEIANTNSDP